MSKTVVDLILHPVRMQIVQCLTLTPNLTTAQLAERLPSVPQASLYRHLSKLVEAGLIAIVEQNQVRGTLEKVYGLSSTSPFNSGVLSKEEHMRYFLAFTARLTHSFEQYLNWPNVDPANDWASYRMARIYATDEEFTAFLAVLRQAFSMVIGNLPTPERKGIDLATISIPVAKENKEEDRNG